MTKLDALPNNKLKRRDEISQIEMFNLNLRVSILLEL